VHARAVRGTGVSPSSFEFCDGFGRSVERVLPGPLYIRKRDRWWFFTLLLASCFGFRNLREIARERKPRTLSAPPPPPSLGDGRPGNRRSAARPVALLHRHSGQPEGLVADGLLRPLSGDPQPKWMVPPSGSAPSPPSGYVLSFISFHERGFGVPASRFMRAILHFYGVELHNLNPNSMRKQPSLRRFAKDFWGLTPTGICGPISSLRSLLP
jgi:hypothetical protein